MTFNRVSKSYFCKMVFVSCICSSAVANELTFAQNSQGEMFSCAHDNLKHAYDMLGHKLTFTTYPSKRALKHSNAGVVDGEMLRVKGVERAYPNLIPIPVTICAVELVLLANESVELSTLEEIKNYHLGITMGYVHQENFAKTHNLDVTRVAHNDLLVELLYLKRVDLIFLTRPEAEAIVNKDKRFKVIEYHKEQIDLIHYLHKKHQNLVPLVTETLKHLESAGKLDIYKVEFDRKPMALSR